jgi:hypothetical protein
LIEELENGWISPLGFDSQFSISVDRDPGEIEWDYADKFV